MKWIKPSERMPPERRQAYFVKMGQNLEHGTLWPAAFKKWQVAEWLDESPSGSEALPSSTPQSVEGILNKHLAGDGGDGMNIRFSPFDTIYRKKVIAAMQEYGNQLVGDKEREIDGLNKIIILWRNLNDKQEKEINESQKEVEELKNDLKAITILYENQKAENENRLRTQPDL